MHSCNFQPIYTIIFQTGFFHFYCVSSFWQNNSMVTYAITNQHHWNSTTLSNNFCNIYAMIIKAIQKILKNLSFYFYFVYGSGSTGSKKSCGMFIFLIKAV